MTEVLTSHNGHPHEQPYQIRREYCDREAAVYGIAPRELIEVIEGVLEDGLGRPYIDIHTDAPVRVLEYNVEDGSGGWLHNIVTIYYPSQIRPVAGTIDVFTVKVATVYSSVQYEREYRIDRLPDDYLALVDEPSLGGDGQAGRELRTMGTYDFDELGWRLAEARLEAA